MPIPAIIRRRLDLQGYTRYEWDLEFAQIVPWLRFTPALEMIALGLAILWASPLILLGLALLAIWGALFGVHPADLIYNYGLRTLTRTPPLPKNPGPRRFGFALTGLALVLTGWLFHSQALPAGYILGIGLTLIPAINVLVVHLCLWSLVYRLLFGWQRRVRIVEGI